MKWNFAEAIKSKLLLSSYLLILTTMGTSVLFLPHTVLILGQVIDFKDTMLTAKKPGTYNGNIVLDQVKCCMICIWFYIYFSLAWIVDTRVKQSETHTQTTSIQPRQLTFIVTPPYQYFTLSVLYTVNSIILEIAIYIYCTGLILGVRPANERRRYFVTTSLIGWVQS